jgi:transcriptional regulator with XRE-family HTH domain
VALRRKVAGNIKKIRTQKGYTQERLAELSGFHYKYYQKIESGMVNLTIDSLERLAKTLKISVSKLFD